MNNSVCAILNNWSNCRCTEITQNRTLGKLGWHYYSHSKHHPATESLVPNFNMEVVFCTVEHISSTHLPVMSPNHIILYSIFTFFLCCCDSFFHCVGRNERTGGTVNMHTSTDTYIMLLPKNRQWTDRTETLGTQLSCWVSNTKTVL